jgi:signal transduction histidine kinase
MSESTPVFRSSARPHLLDAGIAFALFALALMYLGPPPAVADSGIVERDFLGIVFIALMTLPLIWRQVAPRTVLTVISIIWMLDRAFLYDDTVAMLGLIVAIHAVAAFLPARQAYAWGTGVLVATAGWTVIGMTYSDTVRLVHVVTVVLWTVIPFALGRSDALARERLMALESAHLGAERSQREATDAAVRTERTRIARELHDVVAHDITVMTLQAEGARRALGDANPAVTEALHTIGESGRNGLAEMNRMIGVLRDTSEGDAGEAAVGTSFAPAAVSHLDPMPALASLPSLARQVEDAGLPVDLQVSGNAHVPAGVELSAYRIVQESLTNALKHAGPNTKATVVVDRQPAAVTVTVEDDGRGAITDAMSTGGGHGLAGMRERVLSLGGTIELGPRAGGGFRVKAVLPSHDDTVVRTPRRSSTTPAVSNPTPRKGSRP